MSLQIQQTNILPLSLMQSQWKSQIDPVLANPITNMLILESVLLIAGSNVVNHTLGRKQQGWILVDQQGVSSVYRSAPFNNSTLTLTSSAQVMVNIGVF